jgi:hypothetical protein
MGLEKYRLSDKDDGYTNVDVIGSDTKPRWWFENCILAGSGPFDGINVDTTYDNTNRRIGVIDE